MDLAHRDDNDNWVGAEMHFAYGVQPASADNPPVDLTVILEFNMPAFPGHSSRLLLKSGPAYRTLKILTMPASW